MKQTTLVKGYSLIPRNLDRCSLEVDAASIRNLHSLKTSGLWMVLET